MFLVFLEVRIKLHCQILYNFQVQLPLPNLFKSHTFVDIHVIVCCEIVRKKINY